MKRIMAVLCVVLPVLTLAQTALASGAGTTAAEFLRFGVGQPAFMSDASGSCQRGATASYWNPAGLAGAQCVDAYAAHYGLPETVKYDFAGLVLPIRRGVFEGGLGLSVQMLNQGDMTRVDNAGTITGDFSAGDFAAGAAWGGMFGPVRGGLGFRFIRQNIEDSAGSAVALDAGVQRDLGRWSLGAAVTNLGSTLKVGSKAFALPVTLRVGATYDVLKRLTLALDQSVSYGQSARFHAGALFKVAGPMSLGAGYTTGQGEDGPSGLAAGMRLSWNTFVLDASYRPFGELGNAVQIGLGLRFSCVKDVPPAPPPPADTDRDGIADSLDKCPGTRAGIVVDAAGCFPDADADGVADAGDKCPGTPAGTAVDTIGCVAVADADSDGVFDSLDNCPATPANTVVDAQGCSPEKDSDYDGIADSGDKCPGTPPATAVDAAGCVLIADSDADGVNDPQDKCPGTPRGTTVDEIGCAPLADAAADSDAYAFTDSNADGVPDAFVVMQFEYDKAELKTKYAPQLKAIKAFMEANPGTWVELRGHTDDRGTDAYNLKLSKSRAEAVLNYLVKVGGLDAARLSAVGIGKSQPAVSNQTEEGRAANRRVIAVLSLKNFR